MVPNFGRKNRWANSVNIIFPAILIFIILMLIHQINNHVKETRDYYVHTFIDIIRISIEHSEDMTTLNDTSKDIVDYLNQNENRITLIYVYYEDSNIIVPMEGMSGPEPFEFQGRDETIKEIVLNGDKGVIKNAEYHKDEDIYFQWISSDDLTKDILILYSINQHILSIPFVGTYLYTIMAIIALYALCNTFVRRDLYMQVLQRSKKQSIDNLSDI